MLDESRRLTGRIRCFRCSHLSIARLHEQLQLTVIPVILSPLFRCFLSPPSNFLWCNYTFCSFECKCCTRSFSWRPFTTICSDILSTCWMFFFFFCLAFTFHKCCCLSSSRCRWAALCPFSASRDTWSRAPPPGPASPTWPGAERSPSAFVRRAAPHRRHIRLRLFLPAVTISPFSSLLPLQPTPANSRRARCMWTWWGWTCRASATPWCTAVSMATSWREGPSTGSARATAPGRGRCRYVGVTK